MGLRFLFLVLGLLFVVLPSTTNSNSDEVALPICEGEQATGISLTTQKFSVAGEIIERTTLKAEKVDILKGEFSGRVRVSRTYFHCNPFYGRDVLRTMTIKAENLLAEDDSKIETKSRTEGKILDRNGELVLSFVARNKMVIREKTEKEAPAASVLSREAFLKAFGREQLLQLGVKEVGQDEDNSCLDVTGLNIAMAKKTPDQDNFLGQRKIRVDLLFYMSMPPEDQVWVKISPYPGKLTGTMEKTMRLYKTKEAGFVAGTFSFWDRRGLFPGLGSSVPVYKIEILDCQGKELLAEKTVQLLIS